MEKNKTKKNKVFKMEYNLKSSSLLVYARKSFLYPYFSSLNIFIYVLHNIVPLCLVSSASTVMLRYFLNFPFYAMAYLSHHMLKSLHCCFTECIFIHKLSKILYTYSKRAMYIATQVYTPCISRACGFIRKIKNMIMDANTNNTSEWHKTA